MRRAVLTMGWLAVAMPLAAQNSMDQDVAVTGGGPVPAGWHLRFDRADAKAENVKFMSMGSGYHVTAGPAAIYYNPKYLVKGGGNFTASGSFTLMKPSAHPEAFGLFFAGVSLTDANQAYLYFLVRQDGKFTVRHRAGADVHPIMEWTENAAVKKPDDKGTCTNELSVRVADDSVRMFVNGTQVAAFSHQIMAPTDGQVGLRVNHNLDVHIGSFDLKPASK
jgi:hypothetical protein